MKLHFPAALMAVVLASFCGPANSQAYPSKPVKIVVGYAPGGPVDSLARVLASKLGDALKQQFIVENRPGASSMIGAQHVAQAAPDGYTLLMVASTHAVNPSLHKKMAFDTEKDFAPVSLISESSFVLVVPSSLPIKSVADLVSHAKNDKIHYASAGVGGLPHLSAELFKTMAGIDANHVPYKGAAPATFDLVAGHVSFMFNNLLSALPGIKDGRLRPIAVTTEKRSPALPDVPTIAEGGFKGYNVSGWYGLLAPAGTNLDNIDKLNRELNRILQSPDVVELLAQNGMTPTASTPQEFAALIHEDIIKWAAVIKDSNATAD